MGLFYQITILLFTTFSFHTASPHAERDDETPKIPFKIVPQPNDIRMGEGWVRIDDDWKIYFSQTPKNQGVDDVIFELFRTVFKKNPSNAMTAQDHAINFIFSQEIKHPEGYVLDVQPERINIYYNNEAGAYYATQSLRQMVIRGKNEAYTDLKNLTIPCAVITDEPRFAYRGMHLDECRHFFGMETVKKYIDVLALQKMNSFHWHLTDDQGWRIEIKKYPKLTSIGGCRSETRVGHYSSKPEVYDGKPYCGYYTQDQIKEIVKYAADRFINVVPEIEMPGHARAALTAYPKLGCTTTPTTVATTWGVFEEIFCPYNVTFEFLEDVLDEVIQLFPSKLIHVGGDEVPKDQWQKSKYCQQLMKTLKLKNEAELQSYFMKRIEKYISSKNRRMIGWDEIMDGGIAPNATIMSWRGTSGGEAAANQGHDVVMTPGGWCYFDHYQSKDSTEPVAIGGYTPIEKVYEFEPIPSNLSLDKRHHILGAQANLWTEYILDSHHLQYMAYPRSFALAEVLWTQKDQKKYDDFLSRLSSTIRILDEWNVNYSKRIFTLDE